MSSSQTTDQRLLNRYLNQVTQVSNHAHCLEDGVCGSNALLMVHKKHLEFMMSQFPLCIKHYHETKMNLDGTVC